MKHRWTGGVLLAVALTVSACAPPDAGAGDPTPSPAADEATGAPTMSPESAAPEPTQYGQDEY